MTHRSSASPTESSSVPSAASSLPAAPVLPGFAQHIHAAARSILGERAPRERTRRMRLESLEPLLMMDGQGMEADTVTAGVADPSALQLEEVIAELAAARQVLASPREADLPQAVRETEALLSGLSEGERSMEAEYIALGTALGEAQEEERMLGATLFAIEERLAEIDSEIPALAEQVERAREILAEVRTELASLRENLAAKEGETAALRTKSETSGMIVERLGAPHEHALASLREAGERIEKMAEEYGIRITKLLRRAEAYDEVLFRTLDGVVTLFAQKKRLPVAAVEREIAEAMQSVSAYISARIPLYFAEVTHGKNREALLIAERDVSEREEEVAERTGRIDEQEGVLAEAERALLSLEEERGELLLREEETRKDLGLVSEEMTGDRDAMTEAKEKLGMLRTQREEAQGLLAGLRGELVTWLTENEGPAEEAETTRKKITIDFSSLPDGPLTYRHVMEHPELGRIRFVTDIENVLYMQNGRIRGGEDGAWHLTVVFLDRVVTMESLDVRRLKGERDIQLAVEGEGLESVFTLSASESGPYALGATGQGFVLKRTQGSAMELASFTVDASIESDHPTRRELRFDGEDMQGTVYPNFATVRLDALGDVTLSTGGIHGTRVVDGVLQGGKEAKDAVVLNMEDPVHIKEIVLDKVWSHSGSRKGVILQLFKDGKLVFTQRVLTGPVTVPVGVEADTISMTPEQFATGAIAQILRVLSPEEQRAMQTRNLEPEREMTIDVKSVLAHMMPQHAMPAIEEWLPAKGTFPAHMHTVGSFQGSANLRASLAGSAAEIVMQANPTLRIPSQEEAKERFLELHPHFRSENREDYRAAQGWSLSQLNAVHAWEDAKYFPLPFSNFQEDLRSTYADAVEYVLAAFDHNVERMNVIRSRMVERMNKETSVQRLGYQFPAIQQVIAAAVDAVTSEELWGRVMETTAQVERAIQAERRREESATYAGDGSSVGWVPNDGPSEASIRRNREIVVGQHGEGSAEVIAYDQRWGTGATESVLLAANPTLTDVTVTGVAVSLPASLQRYVVQSGDSLSGIAARYGIADWRSIWDAPENAQLKNLRGSERNIQVGDVIVVPNDIRNDDAAFTWVSGNPYDVPADKTNYWASLPVAQAREDIERYVNTAATGINISLPSIPASTPDDMLVMNEEEQTIYREFYRQFVDLLALIHKGFNDVKAEYDYRISLEYQNIAARGAGMSFADKVAAYTNIAAYGTLKTTIAGVQLFIPATPLGLGLELATVAIGGPLLKHLPGFLRAAVTKADSLAGTNMLRTVDSRINTMMESGNKLIRAVERMRIHKVLHGTINSMGVAIGGHSQNAIGKTIRIVEDLGTNAQGVRKARIAILNESGEWVTKTGNTTHTFFPSDWSDEMIIDAVDYAFKNGEKVGPDKWEGIYNGIKIVGYEKNGFITSVFPTY